MKISSYGCINLTRKTWSSTKKMTSKSFLLLTITTLLLITMATGNVTHSGDSKHGKDDGYDEKITINLDGVAGVSVIMFTLSAYSGGTLKDCETASLDIKSGETHVANFSAGGLDSGSMQSAILAILFRHPDKGSWYFAKICQPVQGREFMACMRPMRKFVDKVLDPGAVGERTLNMDKTFNMVKGDMFTLPAGLTKFNVGLGWTCPGSLDLDASCIMLKDEDNDGDLDPQCAVYFGHKRYIEAFIYRNYPSCLILLIPVSSVL